MSPEKPLPPDGGEASDKEVNEYLERLEEQLTVDARGSFRPHQPDHHGETSKEYYEKACAKAQLFIKEIDPDLTVSVGQVVVRPARPDSQEYRTYALRFSHKTRATVSWTMEIEEDNAYIEKRLEEIVRQIYKNKILTE
jgi:hypothetical protein